MAGGIDHRKVKELLRRLKADQTSIETASKYIQAKEGNASLIADVRATRVASCREHTFARSHLPTAVVAERLQ